MRRLPPAALAMLLQAAAVLLALSLVRLLSLEITVLGFSLLTGVLAASLSRLAGQARWWLFIQLAFASALAFMLAVHLPPLFYLVAFVLLVFVYWSTFRSQVPLYLSSEKVWRALESLLPQATGQGFRFIDIGSGLGGVLAHLSAARPDGHYAGVENAPLPYLASWLRLRTRPNCTVKWGSLWDTDLSQYDVVFAYLSPVPMAELWEKARREMRPGSLFISNTFAIPEYPPQQTLQVDDLHKSSLFVWRM